MYPSQAEADHPIVRELCDAIRTVLGREAEFFFSHSANDTGYFTARGIPAVNFGAREPRFQHTRTDLVPLSNVVDAAKVFAFLGLRSS